MRVSGVLSLQSDCLPWCYIIILFIYLAMIMLPVCCVKVSVGGDQLV